MTRRDWILAWAVGFMCLLPACTRQEVRQGEDGPREAAVAKQERRPSPYHEIAVSPQAPQTAPVGPAPVAAQPTQEPAVPTKAAEEAEAPSAEVITISSRNTEDKPPQDEPLVSAVRCFINKHPAEAVEHLKRYDKSNQNLLLSWLPLTARLAEVSLDKASPEDLTILLDQMDVVLLPLRSRAALVIDRMCFCREIVQFGVYDPLPEDYAFQAGRDGRNGELVHVYAELRNFSSMQNGTFSVRLPAATMQIYDYNQKLVYQDKFLVEPDQSRAPRRDYFLTFDFCVPRKMPPGSYTLWLEVEDQPTKRKVKKSLDFRVTATNAARSF